jgi:hypothetical protein
MRAILRTTVGADSGQARTLDEIENVENRVNL